MRRDISPRPTSIGVVSFATTLVGACLCGATATAAHELPYLNPATQRLWQKHIPDFYQHQKWGNGSDALLDDETWQTFLAKTEGPKGEILEFPLPTGWSRHAATANMFHHWRVMGFTNMAPAGTASNSSWLNTANAAVKSLAAQGSDIAAELLLRNQGQNAALGQRLSYLNYTIEDGQVRYRSASGAMRTVRAGGQPAPIGLVAAAEFAAGATVNTIVKKTGAGPFSTQLWWGNYHAMTLAGIDLGARALFVADPDSNKGNADDDAGWSGAWPDPAVIARKYTPWNGSADVVPVPALGPGFPASDPVNFGLRYMPLQLAGDLRTIDGSVVENGRFRNVRLDALEIIRVTAAGTAPVIVPTGGALNHSFEIGNGFGQGGDIAELWVIPIGVLESVTCIPTVEVLDPWFEVEAEVTVIPAGTPDPHGNLLDHDAIRIVFTPALHGEAFAQLTFCTSRGFGHFSDGYDVLIRSRELEQVLSALPPEVRALWPNAEAIFLPQTFGGQVQAYIPGDQTIAICVADFNADGVVDGADLGILLTSWGPSLDRDLTGDGIVDGADLGVLLALWGECSKE